MTKRRWIISASVVLVAAAVAAIAWFEPHKLFIDEKVNEAAPTVPTSASGSATTALTAPEPTPTTEAGPAVVARGEFVSRDHGTSGTASVLDLGGGDRVLRLEDFATENGPDVFVYLSTNPAGGQESVFDDDFVNLGRMKGNIGNQNYPIEPNVDLSRFKSVVIWCDRFNSAFGAADLVA